MSTVKSFQVTNFLVLSIFFVSVFASFKYSSLRGQLEILLDVGGYKLRLDPEKKMLQGTEDNGDVQIPAYFEAFKKYKNGMKKIDYALKNYESNNYKHEINQTLVNFLAFLYTIEGLTKDIRYHGWRYHEMSYDTLAPKYALLGKQAPKHSSKIVTCYTDQANERMERMASLLGHDMLKPVCKSRRKTKLKSTSDVDCCQYLLHVIIQMSTNLGPDVDYLLYFKNISEKQAKRLQGFMPKVTNDPVKFFENGKKELKPFLEMNLKFQETFFPGKDNCVSLFGDTTIEKKINQIA